MQHKQINKEKLKLTFENIGKKAKHWKNYLPIINLSLFGIIAILAIVCVFLVNAPAYDVRVLKKQIVSITIAKQDLPPLVVSEKEKDVYENISRNNPFSMHRKPWKTKPLKNKRITNRKIKIDHAPKKVEAVPPPPPPKPRGKPKEIKLQGIIILGDEKKALIENPDRAKRKDPFIFIGKGEQILDYTVKDIEEDRIKLDWYGEEVIYVMRSKIN